MAKGSRKRRRDSWGAITEVHKGEVYRIRYWAETPEGYRRCSETVRGTRKDAEKRRAELMLEHGSDAPCPTVGYVWDKYVLTSYDSRLEHDEISSRTYTSYTRSFDLDVRPVWGDVPCDEVRPLAIQQWLSGLTLSKARRAINLLSTTLDFAVRYEFVDRNAAREKYLMPSETTVVRRDDGIWNYEELAEVWKAVIRVAPWMEPAFIIAAFGGARVSESLGVIAGEIEFLEVDGVPTALVPIRQQLTKEEGVSSRLKTKRSARTTVVPGRAALRLKAILADTDPSCYATNNGLGKWVSRDKINDTWRLKIMPQLPEGQRHLFKNLRKSWETNCRWLLEMDPWITEPMMGHVGEGITARHYDKPQAMMFAKAMARAYSNFPYDREWDFID